MPTIPAAKPTISFSGTGSSLQINFDIKHLSGRDKVNLCRELMDQLGITEALCDKGYDTGSAQQIIVDQWNKYWN